MYSRLEYLCTYYMEAGKTENSGNLIQLRPENQCYQLNNKQMNHSIKFYVTTKTKSILGIHLVAVSVASMAYQYKIFIHYRGTINRESISLSIDSYRHHKFQWDYPLWHDNYYVYTTLCVAQNERWTDSKKKKKTKSKTRKHTQWKMNRTFYTQLLYVIVRWAMCSCVVICNTRISDAKPIGNIMF